MTGYELSNTNGNNKPKKHDDKKELARGKGGKRGKKEKLVPTSVKKNSLVNIANKGKEVCIKVTKEMIKVTGEALVIVGNKLKSIDWKKVLLTFLTEMISTDTTNETNNNAQSYYYEYTEPQAKRTVKQEQIKASKQDYIEEKKNKHIGVKKTQNIKTNKNTKQIAKKKNAEISEKNPLMIEKKDKN